MISIEDYQETYDKAEATKKSIKLYYVEKRYVKELVFQHTDTNSRHRVTRKDKEWILLVGAGMGVMRFADIFKTEQGAQERVVQMVKAGTDNPEARQGTGEAVLGEHETK